MKYFVIVLNLVSLLGSNVSAQGVWGSSSSKKSSQKPFGLMVGFDAGMLGRSDNLTMAEGNFYAGMLFGRKETQLVLMAGSFSESEIVEVQQDGNVYWDPACGCQTQSPVRDFSNRLKIGYFQAGFAYAKKNTTLYAVAGIGQVNRRSAMWLPLNDSLEVLEMVQQPRKTALSGAFSGMFKKNSDLVIIDGLGFFTRSEIFGRAKASYLLGFDKGQFYGGPLVGLNSNAVTGFEGGSGYEILFGPQLLISGTEELNIAYANLSGGVAYNTVPGRGIGFWFNFSMSLSRLNKSIFP